MCQMNKDNKKVHIILASKSERRKDILKREGFDFEIYVPRTEEKDIIGEKYSEKLVSECAREKAEAAYKELSGGSHSSPVQSGSQSSSVHVVGASYASAKDGSQSSLAHAVGTSYASAKGFAESAHMIIVSCDTVVVNDGIIIGKPKDRDDAKRILKSLSGKRHRVISAVCICKGGEYHVKSDTTYVEFRNLSDEEIENYINERKPYDKAGSYGIQDEKFDFVESIEGSMDNVVGFPIEKFKEMLGGLAAVPVHYRATELCIKVSKPFCERQETLNSSPVP